MRVPRRPETGSEHPHECEKEADAHMR
jgi:hypothetical protein